MKQQIKSQKRVRDYGEVYTNKREVDSMISLVSNEVRRLDSNVLEPACGNGNFLEAILREKISTIDKLSHTAYEKELYTIRAVCHIYGIDIMNDNVNESRTRLFNICCDYIGSPSKSFIKGIKLVLKRNIQCGDTLSCETNQGKPIVISEWDIKSDGTVIRKDFYYSDILNGTDKCYNRYKYTWMKKNIYVIGALENG